MQSAFLLYLWANSLALWVTVALVAAGAVYMLLNLWTRSEKNALKKVTYPIAVATSSG